MENQLIWEVRSPDKTVQINVGDYTSFIDDNEEQEEELLENIHQYFQKRSNRTITIIDKLTGEIVDSNEYRSFIINHHDIDNEHQLGSTGLLNKKLQRDLLNNLETDGYLNSINILMEDFLALLEKDMPLKVKRFDHKQFIKQLTFEFDYTVDYSRLINRLLEIIPLLVDEMNTQSLNKTLLIYLYPESNLSPKEQVKLNELLRNLNIKLFVLTDSSIFFSEKLDQTNYFRNGQQVINNELISELHWNSPLDFQVEDIKTSLRNVIENYSSKFELEPIISNYRLTDIILFNTLDLYVCCYSLKYFGHNFKLDLNRVEIPGTLAKYLDDFMKNV